MSVQVRLFKLVVTTRTTRFAQHRMCFQRQGWRQGQQLRSPTHRCDSETGTTPAG